MFHAVEEGRNGLLIKEYLWIKISRRINQSKSSFRTKGCPGTLVIFLAMQDYVQIPVLLLTDSVSHVRVFDYTMPSKA